MNYIVVGCGRVGAELAYSLYLKGHKVSVIDHIAAAFNNLHPDFRGKLVEGEALNRDVLYRAGIETADGLVSVTNSDTLNAVVAHIARTAYNIPRLVVRNYDPGWLKFHEAFGFQTVSSSSWGAQRIKELLEHPEMHSIYSAGNGEVEIYEFIVPNSWDGHKLGDIVPQENCVPVSLTRAGIASIPTCETLIRTDDIILVSATAEGIEALRQKLFQQPEG